MNGRCDGKIYDSLRTWAEIDLDALRENFKKVKAAQPDGVGVCAVVKADAYGHGATEVAHALDGAAAYAVAMTDEGERLRLDGIKEPIIVLGHTPPSDYGTLSALGIATTVTSLGEARLMEEFCERENRTIDVHIAVDTGMTRIGVSPDGEGVREAVAILRLPRVRTRGIFSHFATADCADKTGALHQRDVFVDFAEKVRKEGVELPALHLCNSAAAIEMKDRFDMVRAGIVLYGLLPSDEVDLSPIGGVTPVMSLRSHVSRVRAVDAGTPVSYGGTFVTERQSLIATVSAGYADGIPRLISNRGEVIVRGRRAPIVGRVCMDQMMIDATDIPDVRPGDAVTMFGSDGGETITADEVAAWAQTIGYELICSVTGRVPRVYVEDGEIRKVRSGILPDKEYTAE